jgi:hypothetical protein
MVSRARAVGALPSNHGLASGRVNVRARFALLTTILLVILMLQPGGTAGLRWSAGRLAAAGLDSDGDGYDDATEIQLGEDPSYYCKVMRADVNGDQRVSVLDLSLVGSHFLETVSRRRLGLTKTATIV